jgi:hypothetical protein
MASTDPGILSLTPLPAAFAATRSALHRVAEEIIAPARKPDNEIALEATPGGFGTPWFEHAGARQRVRVQRDELVHEFERESRRTPLGSLRAAGALVAPLLSDPPTSDEALNVDPEAADALARWYAVGDLVLERLIAEAGPGDEPSPVHLWPEHFDIAVELGSNDAGIRANYGFSPGDDDHPEPYAYVGPWSAEVEGELWQAHGFRGAELGYSELLAADDPVAAALQFSRKRKVALIRTAEANR